MRKQDCVEHFIEGQAAWKTGALGLLTRWRGIFLSGTLFTVITMGPPWWWPKASVFSKPISCTVTTAFIVVMVVAGSTFIVGAFYLRWRARRSLNIKTDLHRLVHYMRDQQTKIYHQKAIAANPQANHNDDMYLCALSNQLCDHVRQYFWEVTRDFTVEAAIRLAMETVDQQNKLHVVYKTIGRSSGLNHRAGTSEDIPSHEGIPRHFLEQNNCLGVFVYYDIPTAIMRGTFKHTKNEALYPDDIKTMMVAPLNAWDGNKQGMIGILYVSSRRQHTFDVRNIDSMRFMADSIASFFAFIGAGLRKANSTPIE